MRHLGDPISRRIARPLGWYLPGGYEQKVLGYEPIAYWPLNETSGATATCLTNAAMNGTYTGVTLGQTVTDANGVSFVCPLFDGTNDYVNIYSAALAAAFDGNELTIALWTRVNSAGVWTDGTYRMMTRLAVNASNRTFLAKTNVNNTAVGSYRGGGGAALDRTVSTTLVPWMHWAITGSDTANEYIVYLNGVQQGATMSGTGTWAGALSATDCCIGARDTSPQQLWHGWLAHVAIFSRALTAPDVADLAAA